MRKRISKEEAGRILQDCGQDRVFWAKNGVTIKNLDELHIALKMMDEDSYKHHVNSERNDFVNWLRDVVNDDFLAKEMLKARNRESAIKKVSERLTTLSGMLK